MSEQISPKRKVVIFSILFFILVVLPAGSWYYLRGGLNWRRQANAELQDFGKIRGAMVIYADGTKENLLKSKVCVLHFFGKNPELSGENRAILDIGKRLVDQFGYKPGMDEDHFRMVMIAEGGTAEFKTHAQTLPNADMANWVWTGGMGSWGAILGNAYDAYCQKNGIQPDAEYFALSDTSGTIRRFYNALDDNEVKRMVQQVAILMPK
ncbi:MAG: hypothetical protein IT260_16320 [Saprospiraceae bacterium]|nr:hypothetical protein [Saprospiraceae bacterium]